MSVMLTFSSGVQSISMSSMIIALNTPVIGELIDSQADKRRPRTLQLEIKLRTFGPVTVPLDLVAQYKCLYIQIEYGDLNILFLINCVGCRSEMNVA